MKWKRIAIGPAFLLILALAGAGVLWLQQARTAGAEPEPYFRYYEGTANVKVKNGNAYSVYPVYTCTVVETAGVNGNIIDVDIFGININQDILSDIGELFCGGYCPCEEPVLTLENAVVPEGILPGTFLIATWVDENLTGGTGWKANPLKQTSTQWLFTLKKPEPMAAMIVLNNEFRPMQANTTLMTKFIRNREGIYWKVAGMAPLNANGLPKVTVEIEVPVTGHDSPPTPLSTNPQDSDTVDSDTSMTVTYSEPVNVDPFFVELSCDGYGYQAFNILGQGTANIVIDPVSPLPGNTFCNLYIPEWAVTDVDTVDPPDYGFDWVDIEFFVQASN